MEQEAPIQFQKIESYDLISVHHMTRYRRKCDDCDKRRICTQLTLCHTETKRYRVEWLCNECLHKIANWKTVWHVL